MFIPFKSKIPSPKVNIPLCVPEIRGKEWQYIKECLDTNWVSSVGPFVERFEQMVADYVGTKYAVAAVNGTAALHIALLVAGVQANDEVLVSSLTFIAPANAIRYVGAWPIFIDAEPDYWQMDPEKVVDFLEKECRWHNGALYNNDTNRQVKAILPVHILGHPCDMDPIVDVARKYNLALIEDATECLGAKYKGRMVGNLGDIACFSFNGNKIITTGGGGMIVTDKEAWADRAKYLTTQARDDPVEYIHNEIGYNYRLTNIQAAMGCAQMEKLDEFTTTKRRIATTYTDSLQDIPGITTMREAPWAFSIFWLYTAQVTPEVYKLNNRRLMQELRQNRIESRLLWKPIYQQVPYRECQAYQIKVAEQLYEQCLSLPCSIGISDKEIKKVIAKVVELGKYQENSGKKRNE